TLLDSATCIEGTCAPTYLGCAPCQTGPAGDTACRAPASTDVRFVKVSRFSSEACGGSGFPDSDLGYCFTDAEVGRQHYNCQGTRVGYCIAGVSPAHRGFLEDYCGNDCCGSLCLAGDAAWTEAYERCPGICSTPSVPGSTYDQWAGVCDVDIPDQPPLGSTFTIWHDLRSPLEKAFVCCTPPAGFPVR